MNVGVPGIDEVKTIRQVINLLATSTALPLVIDSPKMETIEAALRYYPGRALINSISGEKEKLRKLLPLAAKYGAMFILLPLTEGEVPETAEKRKIIIREICREAGRYGLTKDDFVVDGLVMTVASNPQAAAEALKTVQWCTEKFQCRTILGLSNVSFGMPERKWINATFLAMAQALGLTMAIVNPASEELMNIQAGRGCAHAEGPGRGGLYPLFCQAIGFSDSPRSGSGGAAPEGLPGHPGGKPGRYYSAGRWGPFLGNDGGPIDR